MDDNSAASGRTAVGASNNSATSTTANNHPIPSAARFNQNPDRQSTTANSSTSTTGPPRTGVVQPKPQALPKRTGPSSIIVSPRQKGNPILTNIKSVPWEYGDIPADYVLGLTTCALFLSLKYHRLHPEYIYTRIKGLQGKYNLRLVLVMVDIQNHEESLRELSKTSLINNVTLILCWSAAEGGRYLELFKTYEHAAPTAIKSHQSSAYSDRMISFITTPRSVNKTDAVSLVSQFGTLRTAVNARHEDVSGIAGWGEKKVQRWCQAVREPFRIQRAARRGLAREGTGGSGFVEESTGSTSPAPAFERGESPARRSEGGSGSNSRPRTADADRRPTSRLAEQVVIDPDDAVFVEDEEAMAEAMTGVPVQPKKIARDASENIEQPSKKRKQDDDPLNDGVIAALSKLRKQGG